MHKACDDSQSLKVSSGTYGKYKFLFVALDRAAQELHRTGTREDFEQILEGFVFYLSPIIGQVISEKEHDGFERKEGAR